MGERAQAVVVEFDNAVRHQAAHVLQQAGYAVHSQSMGLAAVRLIKRLDPQLVIVGFGLPDIDGLETIRRIRNHAAIDVLALLDLNDEIDVVLALDAGASACINKPLRERDFRADVDSVSRRREYYASTRHDEHDKADEVVVQLGELVIDPVAWEVRLAGRIIAATATEFGILSVLARHPGKVFGKRELARHAAEISGHETTEVIGEAEARSIEVHIANLRKKLGDSVREPQWIETVRGVGYRMATYTAQT